MVDVLGPNVSIDDQAEPAGTIGHEFLTSLKGPLSARVYVNSAVQPATS